MSELAHYVEVELVPGSRESRVPGGRTLKEIEADLKKPGKTLLGAITRAPGESDPFGVWLGPFYMGVFGLVGFVAAICGALFYLYEVVFHGPYLSYFNNFIAGRIIPPPPEAGLSFMVGPGNQGFVWLWVVGFATTAFICWLLREVEICNKLEIGYHVPISFGVVVSAWLTLQIFRPVLMGRWAEGFTLGVLPHLDWINLFGYRYFNFYFNIFHCLGITGLWTSTMVLGLHGSAILSGSQSRYGDEIDRVHQFWYDLIGYSIGELGIHKMATLLAAAAVLVSNLCVLFSGWIVMDWVSFWNWWVDMPLWVGM